MNRDSFTANRDKLFPPKEEENEPFFGDDSSFNFRVNKDLKNEFSQLCKKERFSAAAMLKRYMLQCVKKGEVIL